MCYQDDFFLRGHTFFPVEICPQKNVNFSKNNPTRFMKNLKKNVDLKVFILCPYFYPRLQLPDLTECFVILEPGNLSIDDFV